MKLDINKADTIRKGIEYIIDLTYSKLDKKNYPDRDAVRFVLIDEEDDDKVIFDSKTFSGTRTGIRNCTLFRLLYNDKVLNQGYINTMPSCCGMVIMHNASAGYGVVRKGLGRIGNFTRRFLCWLANYTVVIAQDKESSYNIKVLENSGWESTGVFKNKNSNNNVKMFHYNLRLFDEVDLENLV